MGWARLITYPGGTEEQYRAVVDEVGDAHANAPGRLFLTAGPSERGWQFFMVWETKEAFFAWAREHVGPAHDRTGDRGWKSDRRRSTSRRSTSSTRDKRTKPMRRKGSSTAPIGPHRDEE